MNICMEGEAREFTCMYVCRCVWCVWSGNVVICVMHERDEYNEYVDVMNAVRVMISTNV